MRVLPLCVLLACSKTLDVRAHVISACDQPDTVAQVTSFLLRVEGADLDAPRETSIEASAGRVSLPSVPPTNDARVTLIGNQGSFAAGLGSLDLSGETSASPVNLRLVLGRVGTFVGTTGDGVCSVMQRGRQGQTATRLPDGRVLIAGGETFVAGEKTFLRTVEMFDPATGLFTLAEDLPEGRAYHTATLTGTRVLFCGGQGSLGGRPVALSTCAIYDLTDKSYRSIALNEGRQLHTATLLVDGRIALVAGVSSGGDFLGSTELYDPNAAGERLVLGPQLSHARMQHTATLLADGKHVVIAGGRTQSDTIGAIEVWSPDDVRAAGSGIARYAHTAARTSDGRVLLAGGFVRTDDPAAVTDIIEVFDAGVACADTLALGSARAELFAETLPSGDAVLIAGGVNAMGAPVRDAEVVRFGRQRSCQAVTIETAGSKLKQARTRASTVLLSGGDVLVVGGSQAVVGSVIPADAGELFVAPR